MNSLSLLLPLCLTVQALPQEKAIVNSVGMKLTRIESGQFVMGQGEAPPRSRAEWLERDWDESPAHLVRISRPFYLGTCEVTNAQYERFDPAHKKFRGLEQSGKGDNDPVVFVTWQQAVDYCQWLSQQEGKPYRLPTEAEWEYACRAGTTTTYSTGATLGPAQANIGRTVAGKPQGVRAVGGYPANPWGLQDLHGNVAEWCHDWYGPYEPGLQTDPVGRAGGYARVVRGWSYLVPSYAKDAARYCRSSNRSGHLPSDANKYTGFRVVLGELPKAKPLPVVALPQEKDVRQGPAPTIGPDPKKPHFINYSVGGKNPTIPKDSWGPIFSQHNHYAAVCVCPNGDVLAAWYTCVGEPGRELCQAASRLRAGSDRWEPAALFFDVPDVNDHAPVLFSDGKRLHHFCTQSFNGWDHASNIVRTSDDNGASWSVPRVMLARHDPKALSQPCCALKLRAGTLVLACDGDHHKDERLLVSQDGGETWRVGAGCMRQTVGKYAIHPATVQLAGGGLLTFLRGPHPMPAVLSTDLGDSYQLATTPFPGIGSGQRVAALKLRSGALLVCSQDNRKELVGGGTFAALSLDDGKTWAHVRKVEGVGGYLAVDQAPNGVIYLFGSRMGCVAFNEAWVKEGQAISR